MKKQFKMRCSAIGQIMGEIGLTDNQKIEFHNLTNKVKLTDLQVVKLNNLTVKKNDTTLPETCRGYLETWVKEQIYNRSKEFSNKYTDKGITVEDNSIDYIAEQLGYGMLLKNTVYYEGDYLTGTPDVILKDLVIDVKNSWDCFTFPLFADSVPNKAYYWQLQGYMGLTGTKSAKLIYTLLDTPLHIVDNEFNWNNKLELDYEDFIKRYQYKHIPDKYRIKIFNIERNDADIAKIYERVEDCRKYIKQLI